METDATIPERKGFLNQFPKFQFRIGLVNGSIPQNILFTLKLE